MAGDHQERVDADAGLGAGSFHVASTGRCTSVAVELPRPQIDVVLGWAERGGVVPFLLSRLPRVRRVLKRGEVLERDRLLPKGKRLSGSLLSGLLLLACFPSDGAWCSLTEAARRAGMSSSTAHRYVATFVEAGLLVQDSSSRTYRLARRSEHGPDSSGCVGVSGVAGSDDASSTGESGAVIELSSEQVDGVRRVAAEKHAASALLSGLLNDSGVPEAALELLENPRLSRSFLTGLLILAVLPLDGSFIRNADVARRLGMTPPTTHRYVRTLRAAGLVERDQGTPRFGLAL